MGPQGDPTVPTGSLSLCEHLRGFSGTAIKWVGGRRPLQPFLFPAPWFHHGSQEFHWPHVPRKWLWQYQVFPAGRTVVLWDPHSSRPQKVPGDVIILDGFNKATACQVLG